MSFPSVCFPCVQEVLQASLDLQNHFMGGVIGETSNLGQSPSDSVDDTVFSTT